MKGTNLTVQANKTQWTSLTGNLALKKPKPTKITLSTLFYRAYLSIISITESNKEQTGNKKKEKKSKKASARTWNLLLVGFFLVSRMQSFTALLFT